MVGDAGQLYTIEGIAAGFLMIVTAYLVVSTTTVFTPQDVHIIDMQLQQLGDDVLTMMDTPNEYGEKSILVEAVENYDMNSFRDQFLQYANKTSNTRQDNLKYRATIYARKSATKEIVTIPFGGSTYYRENAVTVSRWVIVNNTPLTGQLPNADPRNQTVLLEVLVWRG